MSLDNKGELSPYRVLSDPLPFREEQASESPPHLRVYWRTLLKHRWSAIAVFLAVFVAAAVYTFTRDRVYTAPGSVQIERQAPNVTKGQDVQREESTSYDKYDYYQTQYQILQSRAIAARVIKGLGLEAEPRFADRKGIVAIVIEKVFALIPDRLLAAIGLLPGGGQPITEEGVDSRVIDRYIDKLDINPVRNSRVVSISMTTRFPDLSADITNRHIDEFIASTLQDKLDTSVKAKEFLEDEIAKARGRTIAAETALNDFRKKNKILTVDAGKGDMATERLMDLNQRLTEAQADRIRLDGQCSLISRRNYESLPDVVGSRLIADLKGELSQIEAQRAELGRKFKPGYPKMGEIMAHEQQVQSRLKAEVNKIVGSTESACLAAKHREDELRAQVDQQREAALSERDLAGDYGTLVRDADTARLLYASLLQRVTDVDVAKEIRMSNVSVVDRAAPPRKASKPKKLLNLGVAAAIGLLLGIALAFFLEYLDNTVKTPEDVELGLGLPMLGVVPHFDIEAARARRAKRGIDTTEQTPIRALVQQTKGSTGRELAVLIEPRSIAAEAYRVVRTAVLLSSADRSPQVIVFTSGTMGEGKTVTAINQALTLVQGGGRVLLIDADIRRPRLHEVFNLPNGAGLSTFLAGQSSLESVIHEVGAAAGPHENGNGTNANGNGHFFVVPAGPTSPNPAELLGGRRMGATIELLRQQFDYILFDTPPVLPVADASILSRVSDGVVLVVHGQHTSFDAVTRCRDRLQRVRARILGVVLNNVDLRSPDYSVYYSSGYYSYGTDSHTSA